MCFCWEKEMYIRSCFVSSPDMSVVSSASSSSSSSSSSAVMRPAGKKKDEEENETLAAIHLPSFRALQCCQIWQTLDQPYKFCEKGYRITLTHLLPELLPVWYETMPSGNTGAVRTLPSALVEEEKAKCDSAVWILITLLHSPFSSSCQALMWCDCAYVCESEIRFLCWEGGGSLFVLDSTCWESPPPPLPASLRTSNYVVGQLQTYNSLLYYCNFIHLYAVKNWSSGVKIYIV